MLDMKKKMGMEWLRWDSSTSCYPLFMLILMILEMTKQEIFMLAWKAQYTLHTKESVLKQQIFASLILFNLLNISETLVPLHGITKQLHFLLLTFYVTFGK